MTAIVPASDRPARTPWQLREGETPEQAALFWLWRYELAPIDAELAERFDWARRADWLDTADALPADPAEMLRDGLAYGLTTAFIAQRHRAIRATEDSTYAALVSSPGDFLDLMTRAAKIEIPDRGKEIDWQELLVKGIITPEELELRCAADALDRRLGL